MLRNGHISFGAYGVGPVPLLQDHKCVPHVIVNKVNPDVGPVHFSSLTPLHRLPESFHNICYGDPIYMVLLGWVGGWVDRGGGGEQ